jgi:hypothetical protein
MTEYQSNLTKIQDVPMPNATSCAPECNTRALCYTDFQPNFNPKYLLENVIISGAGNDARKSWRKEVRKPAAADAQGYRDFKVLYEVR